MQKLSSKHVLLEDPHRAIIDADYYNEYQADVIIVMDRELCAIGLRKESVLFLNDKSKEIPQHERFKFVTHADLLIQCKEAFGEFPYLKDENDGAIGRGWIINNILYIAWWGTYQDIQGMWYMIDRYLFNKFNREIYFSYAKDEPSLEDEWIRVK